MLRDLLSHLAEQLHVPVPYEQIPPVTQPHPPFQTPAQFGDPIEAGGWKDHRPRWIQVVPMLTDFEYTTKFRCYEPPVILNRDEVRRLKEYGGLSPSPVLRGSAAPGVLDASSIGAPGSGSSKHSRQDNGYGGAAFGAGGSSALQALYATDAVKQALANLLMDPVTFARYYAPQDPQLAKIVQEHDDKMRERLNEGIARWAEGIQVIQPETVKS